jgi:bleomycin hydrolase
MTRTTRRRHRLPLLIASLGLLACAGAPGCGASGDDLPPAADAPPGPAPVAAVPFLAPPPPAPAGPDRYEPAPLDPVLEELRERDRAWTDARDAETGAIRKRQKEAAEKKRKEKRTLVSSLPAEERPASPEAFRIVPHRPPVAQYMTGTCWSYSATSFLESEVQRVTGREVKLSEMATVYHEYLAKAERFLAERGDSHFGEGSQTNAVLRIWRGHGAYPLSVYPGVVAADGRHDHQRLFRDLEGTLDHAKSAGLWDPETALGMLRVVLDSHLGRPPTQFAFEGRTYTPISFAADVLQLDLTAYVDVLSTLAHPFWTRAELEVADNWWKDGSYLNVPLDDFYAGLKGALRAGYGVAIAVDVSEPGRDADNDVMFVPPWDIPADRIDQLARELRLFNHATTDDHGVHLVGWAEHAGHDWYLAKDSGRSARRGRFEGYYFLRDDYVKLKVLAFTVHRDAIPDIAARFAPPAAAAPRP